MDENVRKVKQNDDVNDDCKKNKKIDAQNISS